MSRSLRKKLAIASAIGLTSLAAVAIWIQTRPATPTGSISSSGGISLDLPAATDGAYYLQNDPQWGADKIGGSGEPMASVGCTICAVAMAAEQLGYPITPQQLNASLIENNGFTERGWLIWSAVGKVTNGKIQVTVPRGLTHAELDSALQNGKVPVVRYTMPSGYPHWVPIVGKSGKEYLVKDPLDAELKISKLSDKADLIHSVRYVIQD
ncbi:cysteine peptidase family C39 domain-containing protein [Sulfuriroseicoccus oceanibius]|uniref:Uncharacterized protein n=1 Tax=Sulfuriroseicoccus oceanibius TaxID=2707525 RepID=A0A6B3L618_9BACT|nr:cysteine peptidase family C39 domain-containing protein [Sulfuriroseicoccus oceanibius]QQL46001.1 hypothetical protein G3M56_005325 [Sulfuriroseicoccus oceanibius]